jgi:hypothetical protein
MYKKRKNRGSIGLLFPCSLFSFPLLYRWTNNTMVTPYSTPPCDTVVTDNHSHPSTVRACYSIPQQQLTAHSSQLTAHSSVPILVIPGGSRC